METGERGKGKGERGKGKGETGDWRLEDGGGRPDENTRLGSCFATAGGGYLARDLGDWIEWDPANPYAVETEHASTYTFQAFSDTESSPAVIRNYYPLLLPSFFSDTILINNTGTINYNTLSFTDTLLDGTVYQLEEALYRIPVYRTYTIEIDWQDSTSVGTSSNTSVRSTYTSQADFTLLEEDYFTEVLDTNGVPVASKPILHTTRSSSGYGNPVTVTLHPGTYYLYIIDTDSIPGGTVGFSIKTTGGSR